MAENLDTTRTEPPDLDDGALEALARAVAVDPPGALRGRVVEAVRREAEAERARRSARRWRLAGGLSIAASLLLAILLESERERLGARADDLLASLESQQQEFEVMEEAVAVQREVVRILGSPRLETALLAGPAGAGNARVLLDPLTGRVAVIGSGLEPPQTGRVYAIWAIRGDGTTEPAGVLAPSGGRSFTARMREVVEPRDVREFAISIETDEGATRPTGPVVLTGTVQRTP